LIVQDRETNSIVVEAIVAAATATDFTAILQGALDRWLAHARGNGDVDD